MDDMEIGGGDTGAMDGGAAPAPGYTICIKVGPGGDMSVGVEPPEAPGEAPEDGAFKPAPNASDAMMMVMDIIKNNGKMPEGDGDADFNSGFGKKQTGPIVDKQRLDEEDM